MVETLRPNQRDSNPGEPKTPKAAVSRLKAGDGSRWRRVDMYDSICTTPGSVGVDALGDLCFDLGELRVGFFLSDLAFGDSLVDAGLCLSGQCSNNVVD